MHNKNDKLVLEEKQFQISFKTNLKKKVTYFKSIEKFPYTKLKKEDENALFNELILNKDKFNFSELKIESNLNNNKKIKKNINTNNKTKKDDENLNEKKILKRKQNQFFKREFIFGFNEIVKKLKKNQLTGIILAFNLTTHVQKTLLEIAFNYNTPVLIVTEIELFEKFFGISKLSCFAFNILITEKNSLFNQFYGTFIKINNNFKNEFLKNKSEKNDDKKSDLDFSKVHLKNNLKENVLNENLSERNKICLDNEEKNKVSEENKEKKKLKIEFLPVDLLWIPYEEKKLKIFVPNKEKSDQSIDFVSLNNVNENYFPKRFI